tara:strand:+ start:1224 stop:1631 length:408 start_codon:yes stop_codon:yes gene_type:complete
LDESELVGVAFTGGYRALNLQDDIRTAQCLRFGSGNLGACVAIELIHVVGLKAGIALHDNLRSQVHEFLDRVGFRHHATFKLSPLLGNGDLHASPSLFRLIGVVQLKPTAFEIILKRLTTKQLQSAGIGDNPLNA